MNQMQHIQRGHCNRQFLREQLGCHLELERYSIGIKKEGSYIESNSFGCFRSELSIFFHKNFERNSLLIHFLGSLGWDCQNGAGKLHQLILLTNEILSFQFLLLTREN